MLWCSRMDCTDLDAAGGTSSKLDQSGASGGDWPRIGGTHQLNMSSIHSLICIDFF
jgi:hypothetical protein